MGYFTCKEMTLRLLSERPGHMKNKRPGHTFLDSLSSNHRGMVAASKLWPPLARPRDATGAQAVRARLRHVFRTLCFRQLFRYRVN